MQVPLNYSLNEVLLYSLARMSEAAVFNTGIFGFVCTAGVHSMSIKAVRCPTAA